MKVILIDTPKKEIREVNYHGNFHQIYEILGFNCQEFLGITLNGKRDTLYVDAEARDRIAGDKDLRAARFKHKRYHSVLFGRGLVIGSDEDGESQKPHTDIETLQREIMFL